MRKRTKGTRQEKLDAALWKKLAPAIESDMRSAYKADPVFFRKAMLAYLAENWKELDRLLASRPTKIDA